MDELKPCPFCGGEAVLFVDDGAMVVCKKCLARTMSMHDRFREFNLNVFAAESVIRNWNFRYNDK